MKPVCQCPNCGKFAMYEKIFPTFSTKINKVPIVVKNAKIIECSVCGEKIYHAKEIKRWEKIARRSPLWPT